MNVFETIGRTVVRTATKANVKVRAKSPEILLVCGAVTFVGTVVVACKQTLKCEDVLDEHQRKMDDIANCLELAKEEDSGVNYTIEEAKKDKAIAFVQTSVGFAKVYAPAIILGVISLTCFGCSYNIMRKRQLALSLAYGAIDTAFNEYRERVRGELGEEADKRFRYGYETAKKKQLITKVDENGELKEEAVDPFDSVPWEEGDGTLNGATFVFAPETSKYYFPDEVHNEAGISAARTRAQIDFDSQGFLFLNDVLEDLGLQKVPYGQLVGWKKGIGDPYIDFRAKPVYRAASKDPNRNPLGLSYECIWEFDFNHCGIIWDKI